MFKKIDETVNLNLWGSHDIRINRNGENAEIVVYPQDNKKSSVGVRYAVAPYRCTLHLANGDDVCVDLADEGDWGNIQGCLPSDCEDWKDSIGWGNDSDGHTKIVSVTDDDGNEIPLKDFERDVGDYIVYFEA